MRDEHINHEFLDPVVAGTEVDAYYHLGLRSDDDLVPRLREVRAIVLAGSGDRIVELAERWHAENPHAPLIAIPKEERFVTRYCAGVLFVSHGMGMASASIAVQELMRLVHFLKAGDHAAMDEVLWVRLGTSGGIGLPAGSVVATTEAVMVDLRPFRVLHGSGGDIWFDGRFPEEVVAGIVEAGASLGVPVVAGRTISGNEFFLEQFRRDGAIVRETEESRERWLRHVHAEGVVNIEMEGAMIAGYLNDWGFPRFAMICTTLLDRLQGDQVLRSGEELAGYARRAADVLFAYLRDQHLATGG